MTYRIYYDDRQIHGVDETINSVRTEITHVINNKINICEEQSTKIKETIKEIKKYESDNEDWIKEYDSQKSQNYIEKIQKNLSEEEFEDEYTKYLNSLDDKYPRYDGESYNEYIVEKDLSVAYEYRDLNNESLKKLTELMNQLKELKLYIY